MQPLYPTWEVVAVVCCLVVLFVPGGDACTNYIVSPGASADGSAQISYAADSGNLYGSLGYYPAADHSAGAKRALYDWDSGNYLGEIPEAPHTYNVVGNSNEFQLTITETTFGGLSQFSSQKGALLDYGSLIWVTLQRAKNASEAITVMDELMQRYGYASNGESFSVGDPNEVWIMEIMSKGNGELGSVWVAQKIPDGYVCGHANQARIRTFKQNDPETSRFAPDVIDFARRQGLYNGTDADFSFSDTFDPVSFLGGRMAEIRVWNFFRQVSEDPNFGDKYLDYVKGIDLTNRFPLYIKSKRKIAVNDTFWFMRSHFEDTYFDMRKDVGSGQWTSAYRARPLFWKNSKGVSYHNERPIGVQQTAWNLVAQMRSWMPDTIGTIVWFAVDGTSHSVHVPFYSTISSISDSWKDEGIQHVDDTQQSSKVNFKSAWWITNMVANLVYNRYDDMNPVVQSKIIQVEAGYFEDVKAMDTRMLHLLRQGTPKADIVAQLTTFSNTRGDQIVDDWLDFWKSLFFTFRDYDVVTMSVPKTKMDHPWPHAAENGYPMAWNDVVADSTGDHYKVPTSFTYSKEDQQKLKILSGKGV
jgi:dipeptidase